MHLRSNPIIITWTCSYSESHIMLIDRIIKGIGKELCSGLRTSMLLIGCLLLSFASLSAQEIHTSRYYVSHAEGYVQAHAWSEAKHVIEEGLQHYPDDPELRYMNGQYYYVTGHLNQARYNLVRAIQVMDQHFKAKRLLVDVEDDTKHYSSAICYINELLEFQPYDRDLWRRKIGLYRKLGDDVEADAALERLSRIYPNDSLVQSEQRRRNHQTFNQTVQKNRLVDAAEQLEQWLENDPQNDQYYLELIGLYQRMGEPDRALATIDRALVQFPNDASFADKKIGVLLELERFNEALSYAKRSGKNSSSYRYVMEAIADASRLNDPYDQHARLYAETHSPDALRYMLNTSLTRGYYDDARYYLSESMRLNGRTANLLMKQYELEKHTGNEHAAWKLLQELYDMNPDDEELVEEYAHQHLLQANRDMSLMQWDDAAEHLQQALNTLAVDDVVWPATISKLITCYGQMNKLNEAKSQYVRAVSIDPAHQQRYASAYEDIVAHRLKYLIEEEEFVSAYNEAKSLLDDIPNSKPALRCCINMCETLHYTDDYQYYARLGYENYPDDPYFIVKQAISLQRQGRSAEALALIQPRSQNSEYINPILAAARSGIAEEYAVVLLHSHQPEMAVAVIDSALVYDKDNRELLYTQGLAYEQMKDFANAYRLQKRNYNPSNAEQLEFYEHTRWLHYRSFKNRVDASYTHAIYDSRSENMGSTAHLYSIASVAYSRLCKKDTWTAEVSYKGLDGYHDGDEDSAGGAGVQLMGQWEHAFGHRWTGMISAAWSNRFFNKWSANISASCALEHGWTPSLRLGYRRTPETYLFTANVDSTFAGKYSLFIVTPSVEKSWERIKTTLSVDLTAMESSLYYNVGLKGKLFINEDNISSISLLCGFGSFPELTFFEQTALRNVSHYNSMVGFDAQYMLTDNFYLGLAGSWNTCFNPVRTDSGWKDSYRNIYSLTLQLHMAF